MTEATQMDAQSPRLFDKLTLAVDEVLRRPATRLRAAMGEAAAGTAAAGILHRSA